MKKHSAFNHLRHFTPERRKSLHKDAKEHIAGQSAQGLKQARTAGTLASPIQGIFDHLMEDLRDHLLTAIQLELSTLPPYLTALYSIQDGTNAPSTQIIRSVAMEEMYHFTLAGNILNAVGGQVIVNTSDFIPQYPGNLPDITHTLVASLQQFSSDAIALFMRIEEPQDAPDWESMGEDGGYQTIGEFYEAVERLLDFICDLFPDAWVFSGDPQKQIDSKYYYGGGGIVKPVLNRGDAKWAIKTIVDQGEGLKNGTKVCDGDAQFGQDPEPAHFYRFQEIDLGRAYKCSDTPGNPTGEPFEVDYSSAYSLIPNPKSDLYTGFPEIAEKSERFNQHYLRLLDLLTAAFNNEQEKLIEAVKVMYELKYHAQSLMKIPIPGEAYNAAPTWQYPNQPGA